MSGTATLAPAPRGPEGFYDPYGEPAAPEADDTSFDEADVEKPHHEYYGSDGRLRIVVADLESNIAGEASQAAHERMNFELRGKGLRAIGRRIWKGNLAREYYENKYGQEAKKGIIDGNGLHEYKLDTTLRFAHELEDELIQTDAGERYQKIFGRDKEGNEITDAPEGAQEVRQFISEVVEGYIFKDWATPDDFEEFKRRSIKETLDENPRAKELIGAGVLYADNLTEIAKSASAALNHEIASGTVEDEEEAKKKFIQDLLNKADIITGEARVNAYGNERETRVERLTQKISEKVPGLASEAAISGAVAIAVSVGVWSAQRAAVKGLSTIVTPMVAGGLITGYREAKMLKRERMHHDIAMAENEFDGIELQGRRAELEAVRYETSTAKELIGGMDEFYEVDSGKLLIFENEAGEELSAEQVQDRYTSMMRQVARAEAHLQLSAERKVNLITYSERTAKAKERMDVLVAVGKAKADMKEFLSNLSDEELTDKLGIKAEKIAEADKSDDKGKFLFEDEYLSKEEATENAYWLSAVRSEIVEDIEAKDRLYRKLRNRKVGRAVLKGTLFSGAVSGLGEVVGIAMGAAAGDEGVDLSLDMDLDNNIETALASHSESAPVAVDHAEYRLPSSFSTSIDRNTLQLSGPNNFSAALPLNEDGTLTESAQRTLQERGFSGMGSPTYETVASSQMHETTVNAEAFMSNHQDDFYQITREVWNEPTEPQLDYGGENGTGIDANGNYVVSVERMIDSSPEVREAAASGDLQLMLSVSEGTQSKIIPVEFSSEGIAVINKDTPAASLFTNDHGRAEFVGKYMEAGIDQGADSSGVNHVEVLGTVVGKDQQLFTDTIPAGPEKITSYTLQYDSAQDTAPAPVGDEGLENNPATEQLAREVYPEGGLPAPGVVARSRGGLQTPESAASEAEGPESEGVPEGGSDEAVAGVDSAGPKPAEVVAPTAAETRATTSNPTPGSVAPSPPISLTSGDSGGESSTLGSSPTRSVVPVADRSSFLPSSSTPATGPELGIPSVEGGLYLFSPEKGIFTHPDGTPVRREISPEGAETYFSALTAKANADGDEDLKKIINESSIIEKIWSTPNSRFGGEPMASTNRISVCLLATNESDFESLVEKYTSQTLRPAEFEINMDVARPLDLDPNQEADFENRLFVIKQRALEKGIVVNIAVAKTPDPQGYVAGVGRVQTSDALIRRTLAAFRPAIGASGPPSKPIYAIFDDGKGIIDIPDDYLSRAVEHMDANPQIEAFAPQTSLSPSARQNQFVNFHHLLSQAVTEYLQDAPRRLEEETDKILVDAVTSSAEDLEKEGVLPFNRGVFAVSGFIGASGMHSSTTPIAGRLTALHSSSSRPTIASIEPVASDPALTVTIRDDEARNEAEKILDKIPGKPSLDDLRQLSEGSIEAVQVVIQDALDILEDYRVPNPVAVLSSLLNQQFGIPYSQVMVAADGSVNLGGDGQGRLVNNLYQRAEVAQNEPAPRPLEYQEIDTEGLSEDIVRRVQGQAAAAAQQPAQETTGAEPEQTQSAEVVIDEFAQKEGINFNERKPLQLLVSNVIFPGYGGANEYTGRIRFLGRRGRRNNYQFQLVNGSGELVNINGQPRGSKPPITISLNAEQFAALLQHTGTSVVGSS